MTSAQNTIKHYVGDLSAVIRHVSEALDRHSKDDHLIRLSGATAVIENASTVLKRQLAAMEYHSNSIGGTGLGGAVKETVTSVTGFLTGLYGTLRGETVSRMLRDDYTGLSFVLICTEMLHTTALAVGDSRTADLTRQHIHELPPVIKALSALVPFAVVADIAADKVPISFAQAATAAAQTHVDAWQNETSPSTR